jgi:hypothetical protein
MSKYTRHTTRYHTSHSALSGSGHPQDSMMFPLKDLWLRKSLFNPPQGLA